MYGPPPARRARAESEAQVSKILMDNGGSMHRPAALLALLRRVEWSEGAVGRHQCPCCGAWAGPDAPDHHRAHDDGCDLAAALAAPNPAASEADGSATREGAVRSPETGAECNGSPVSDAASPAPSLDSAAESASACVRRWHAKGLLPTVDDLRAAIAPFWPASGSAAPLDGER
jgi:hypothetical protein